MDRIAEGIESLASGIVSGITDGIKAIFVPSEDFLIEKVETIREEFSFVDSVMEIGDAFGVMFNATRSGKVPYIEISMSGVKSKYYYGDTLVVLDMSWYAPYKPYVDVILSAMMWAFFLWRLFVHTPGIISGLPGVEGSVTISQIPDRPTVGPSHRLETKGFSVKR